jgi:subtilisin family serine protease
MATPHVTGPVALYKALHPQATASQIKAAILNGAKAMSSLNGKVVTHGCHAHGNNFHGYGG